jgi:predicted RNase H-like nuclease (RuvC/YqgF family)
MLDIRRCLLLVAGLLLCAGLGCVSVRAPEKITVGHSEPPPVDTRAVPETSSHEDCRAELYKAHRRLQYLEQENARLEERAAKYKRKLKECEDRLEKYKKD